MDFTDLVKRTPKHIALPHFSESPITQPWNSRERVPIAAAFAAFQSMTRSRALHKLLCDFQEAATAGALAISDVRVSFDNTHVEA